MDISEELKRQVEELGAFFQARNMSPMEARVFALLLLSDPPHQDFYAIRESLSASKSATSNALNRLMNSKRVDFLTLPGDRKRYFKVNPVTWLEEMKVEIASVAPVMSRVQTILEIRQDMDTPAFNEGLERIRSFYAFLAHEFPRLMKRWEAENAEHGNGAGGSAIR